MSRRPIGGSANLGQAENAEGPRNRLSVPASAPRASGDANTNNKPSAAAAPAFSAHVGALGDGVVGFQNSFNTSGKGGGAFQPISENFSANPANGTMSLSLPLRTSPGRSDFHPDLALSYDSGGGNGPFGFGWGVSLPSVSRKTNLSVPSYIDDEDDLTLSGTDIVRYLDDEGNFTARTESPPDGEFDVDVFRPRFDTGTMRIERWTSRSDSSDVHWRTLAGDNTTSIFGDNDQSRIMDTSFGGKRIFSWRLSKSYDSKGNAIECMYKAEDGEGIVASSETTPIWEQNRTQESRCRQKYIKRIRYGNTVPNRDMNTWNADQWPTNWMFEVVFDYGEHQEQRPRSAEDHVWSLRMDPFSQTQAGFEIRNYRICRRVLMFHHFPDRLKAPESLVFSTMLEYDEFRRGTLLATVTMTGHAIESVDSNGIVTYKSTSLPSWTFGYTSAPDAGKAIATEAKSFNLLKLPSAQSKVSEWLDLNGEGMPGLLTKFDDGTLYFQRNNGIAASDGAYENIESEDEPQFSPPSVCSQHPNLVGGTFQDLDRNGHLDYVVRDEVGRPWGYYELADADTWSTFSEFPHTPSGVDLRKIVEIDLTGDSLPDMLYKSGDSRGTLVWQQNLGKQGYSTSKSISTLAESGLQPNISQTTDLNTYVADMSGSGSSDLVEITHSSVRYWQNLGHGVFAAPVDMGNPPLLSPYESFEHSRLLLADVDGSGTTDMVYLLPDGGAMLYYNEAGNSWSEGTLIPGLPTIPDPSSVFMLDILGRGTSCLCWTDPVGGESNKITYLDIMGPIKPHLLKDYSNGLGAITTVTYKPSTKYFVADEKQGSPWTTKLPFPVQCVSTITVLDEITGNQHSTRYTYHNGCYDPMEKQFAGFEMAEAAFSERIALSPNESYKTPVMLTKTWYSVGLGLDINDARFFSKPSITSAISADDQVIASHITDDCFRALRGKNLRSEVYSLDGTPKADFPFEVAESSYELRLYQGQSSKVKYSVVQACPRETLETQYDRIVTDPRVTHTMALKIDKYGNVEESLRVVYPRGLEALPTDLPEDVKKNQLAGNMAHTQVWYTNDVVEGRNFRKPEPYRQQEHEVLNYAFVPGNDIIDIGQAREFNFAGLQTAKADTGSWKALRNESRASYRASSLDRVLAEGKLEAFSLPDQTLTLALSPDTLAKITAGLRDCGIQGKNLDDILVKAGYVKLSDSDSWWLPSSRLLHCEVTAGTAKGKELQAARQSFYTPIYAHDPFGNVSQITMDQYWLLVESMEDAVGNRSSFVNNYEHLKPEGATDPNFNTRQVLLDNLGFETADAALGKGSAGTPDVDTDSLTGLIVEATADQLEDVLANPNGATVRSLLGNANSRTFHDIGRYARWKASTSSMAAPKRAKRNSSSSILGASAQPAYTIHISRALPHGRSTKADISIKVSYLDGHGSPLQEFSLRDPEDAEERWLVSGYAAASTQNQVVCQYQPWYSKSAQFDLTSVLGIESSITFGDAGDRTTTTLAADATWTKSVQGPWSTIQHDAGSLILQQDPREDVEVGHFFAQVRPARFLPTWIERKKAGTQREQKAAQKSSVYANTQVITHLGCCGLPVRIVRVVEGVTHTRGSAYDVNGNRVRDFDSLGRLVEKALYDQLGRQLQVRSMDKGDTWLLQDALDGEILRWNSRQHVFTTVYDKLHRVIENHVAEGAQPSKLITRFTYGESNSDLLPAKNLRTQIWKVEDQAGIHIATKFDIRGHCLEKTFQPVAEYKKVIDWSSTKNALLSKTYSQSSRYDSYGQVLESKDAQGNQTRNHYTRLGHIDKVDFNYAGGNSIDWTSLISSATFTADGLPLFTKYGNNVSTSYAYDSQTRQLVSQVTTRETRGGKGPTQRLEDITHVYDCNGRRVSTSDATEQTKLFSGHPVRPEREFTYDVMGRLASASGRAQLTAAADSGMQLKPYDAMSGNSSQHGIIDGSQLYQYSESYKYDVEGNILFMTHEAPSVRGVTGWTRKYFYEEKSSLDDTVTNNRLSRTSIGNVIEGQYLYEGSAGVAGCMTSLPKFSELDWDVNNMLSYSSTQRVSNGGTPERTFYVYDHEGNRVRKVTESSVAADEEGNNSRKVKETLFLSGVQLQARSDGTELWVAEIRSNDHPLAVVEQSTSRSKPLIRLQIGDGMELDDHGQLVSYEEYSPFGSVVYSMTRQQTEAPRVYRFSKYEHDRETGLYHCGKRYFCPWLGRWTSPDPLSDIDGPNLYEYVGNDPVNFVDPKGTSKLFGPSGFFSKSTSSLFSRGQQFSPGAFYSQSRPRPLTFQQSQPRGGDKVMSSRAEVRRLAGGNPLSTFSAPHGSETEIAKPPIMQLLSGTKGEQHHLFPTRWKAYFWAARINKDLITLHVDPTVHQRLDNTHNANWANRIVSIFKNAFPNSPATKLPFKELAELLARPKEPESQDLVTHIAEHQEKYKDVFEETYRQNLKDTDIPIEEVEAHSQPYMTDENKQRVFGEKVTTEKHDKWIAQARRTSKSD